MGIADRKITVFQNLIANLADKPDLGSTALLKAYFDSSPEELRVALNGAIDDLIADYATKVDLQNTTLGQILDRTLKTEKLDGGYLRANDQLNAGYIVSGGACVKNGSNPKQLIVTSIRGYWLQPDGGYTYRAVIVPFLNTVTPSTTYYLDIDPDGTIKWNTSHSTVANTQYISSVTTDSSGNINVIADLSQRFPIKPAFRAYNNESYTILANTATKIRNNTEVFDLMGNYDPAMSRFTALVDGLYDFEVALTNASIPQGYTVYFYLYINGALYENLQSFNNYTAASYTVKGFAKGIKLKKDDYVEMWATISGAFTPSLSNAYSYFAGFMQ